MDHENTKANFEHLKRGETYTFNLPDMYGRGILTGKLLMEICGAVRIHCAQTDVYAKVIFLPKPLIAGKYNCFRGRVYRREQIRKGKFRKVKQYTFEGRWSAFMRVTRLSDGHTWVPFDVRAAVPLQVAVPPLAEQMTMESQVIWRRVTECLNEGNSALATKHKLALEANQRTLLAGLAERKIPWELQNFHWDQAAARYVPNNLRVAPFEEAEQEIAMPEQFPVPQLLTEMLTAGVVKPIDQVHQDCDAAARAPPPGRASTPAVAPAASAPAIPAQAEEPTAIPQSASEPALVVPAVDDEGAGEPTADAAEAPPQ
jgi:hypothetical protein